MSKRCEFCDKGTVFGRSISHAHNVTNRAFKANLQKIRAVVAGEAKRIWVCTRCLRSGKVQKPVVRDWKPETSDSAAS